MPAATHLPGCLPADMGEGITGRVYIYVWGETRAAMAQGYSPFLADEGWGTPPPYRNARAAVTLINGAWRGGTPHTLQTPTQRHDIPLTGPLPHTHLTRTTTTIRMNIPLQTPRKTWAVETLLTAVPLAVASTCLRAIAWASRRRGRRVPSGAYYSAAAGASPRYLGSGMGSIWVALNQHIVTHHLFKPRLFHGGREGRGTPEHYLTEDSFAAPAYHARAANTGLLADVSHSARARSTHTDALRDCVPPHAHHSLLRYTRTRTRLRTPRDGCDRLHF